MSQGPWLKAVKMRAQGPHCHFLWLRQSRLTVPQSMSLHPRRLLTLLATSSAQAALCSAPGPSLETAQQSRCPNQQWCRLLPGWAAGLSQDSSWRAALTTFVSCVTAGGVRCQITGHDLAHGRAQGGPRRRVWSVAGTQLSRAPDRAGPGLSRARTPRVAAGVRRGRGRGFQTH